MNPVQPPDNSGQALRLRRFVLINMEAYWKNLSQQSVCLFTRKGVKGPLGSLKTICVTLYRDKSVDVAVFTDSILEFPLWWTQTRTITTNRFMIIWLSDAFDHFCKTTNKLSCAAATGLVALSQFNHKSDLTVTAERCRQRWCPAVINIFRLWTSR